MARRRLSTWTQAAAMPVVAALTVAGCGGAGTDGGGGPPISSGGGGGVDNVLLFSANDGTNDVEPWISNGTSTGTRLLRDIHGPGASSNPEGFTRVGDYVIFTAEDSSGRELWRTDGTTAGTEKVLADGSRTPVGVDAGQSFPVLDGFAYFRGNVPTNGGAELWRTDGSTAELVSDIRPGDDDSGHPGHPGHPGHMAVYDGRLYFAASGSDGNEELWVSNGSDSGTELFQNINPAMGESSSPRSLTVSNGWLFFTADDGEFGRELWVSGGTADDAIRVQDINENPGVGSLQADTVLVPFDQGVAFLADDGVNGRELWTADQNSGSANMVVDSDGDVTNDVPAGAYPTAFNNRLYFAANDSGTTGFEPWESGLNGNGARLIQNINPGGADSTTGPFVAFNGLIYFGADDGTSGTELWVTGGEPLNTERVHDINTGGSSSSPMDLTVLDGALYFSANDGTGRHLWRTDGDTTKPVVSDNGPDNVKHLTAIESQ